MIPKTLGACADKLWQLREKRSQLQHQADTLEAEEKAIKEYLINNLPKSEADGVTGKVAKVLIKTRSVPSVKDWDSFYKHILKTGDFSLLARKV